MHYDRASHKPRARSRPERLIYNRARNRTVSVLVDRHREEFEALLKIQLAEARLEAEQLTAATGEAHSKLRAGPRPPDESLEQRVVPLCEQCQTYHLAGHRCPTCAPADTLLHVYHSHPFHNQVDAWDITGKCTVPGCGARRPT